MLIHADQVLLQLFCAFCFRVLCFHADFRTARPGWLDVGLALNLPLLITDYCCFVCRICNLIILCNSIYTDSCFACFYASVYLLLVFVSLVVYTSTFESLERLCIQSDCYLSVRCWTVLAVSVTKLTGEYGSVIKNWLSLLSMKDRALNYLSNCIDQVHTFGDILQLVIVELIYKVCYCMLPQFQHWSYSVGKWKWLQDCFAALLVSRYQVPRPWKISHPFQCFDTAAAMN